MCRGVLNIVAALPEPVAMLLPFLLQEAGDSLRFTAGEQEMFRQRLIADAAQAMAATVDDRLAFRADGRCTPGGNLADVRAGRPERHGHAEIAQILLGIPNQLQVCGTHNFPLGVIRSGAQNCFITIV